MIEKSVGTSLQLVKIQEEERRTGMKHQASSFGRIVIGMLG